MLPVLDVQVIDDPAAAAIALDPIRARLLAELTTPGSAATLAVTGIPHATYDVYFYVYPDENSAGATDRGGSFTVGHKTSGGIDYTRVAGRVRVPERD